MKKRRTYVLDTAALMDDPDLINQPGDADIIIPVAVIRELDGLKNSPYVEKARTARHITRTLDRISSSGSLRKGIELPTRSVLRVYTRPRG